VRDGGGRGGGLMVGLFEGQGEGAGGVRRRGALWVGLFEGQGERGQGVGGGGGLRGARTARSPHPLLTFLQAVCVRAHSGAATPTPRCQCPPTHPAPPRSRRLERPAHPGEFAFGEITPDWDRIAPYLSVALGRVPACEVR